MTNNVQLYPDNLPEHFSIYTPATFDISEKRNGMADFLNNYNNNSNYKQKSSKHRPATDDLPYKSKICYEDDKTVEKRRKVRYYNIRASFDIETTSMIDDEGNKRAHMYCWQFCIDGHVYFGRTLEELKQFFDDIKRQLGLNQLLRLVIYVHNLGFEFQFIKSILNDNMVVFADTVREPLTVNDLEGFEFRCSYRLTGLSLKKVGENLPSSYHDLNKTDGLDYKKIRHSYTPMTSKELEYCMNDVLILDAYIKENIQNNEQYDIATIPLTSTSFVRNYCRKECLKGNTGKSYKKMIDNLTIKDRKELVILKHAFQGGFTHANASYVGKTLENVHSIDFTSSYPTVMISEKYPMSKGRRIYKPDINNIDDYRKGNCCVFYFEFTNLHLKEGSPDCPISFSKCVEPPTNYIISDTDVKGNNIPENNGRLYKAGTCKIIVTDVDFDTINDYYDYDDVKLHGGIMYKAGYLPSELVACVLKLYKDKTELKDVEGKEQEYLVSKGMLNSCYGMAVTNIVKRPVSFIEGGWNEGVLSIDDMDEIVKTYNTDNNRFLFYPWGVWIRAHARRNLQKSMLEFDSDYVYADTDSIKFFNYDKHKDFINCYNKDIISKLKKAIKYHRKYCKNFDYTEKDIEPLTIKGKKKPLGVWDYEGCYDKFKTLGAKRYVYSQGDKFKITVAGLPKKKGAQAILDECDNDVNLCFEYFNDNMHIDTEGLKQASTYIDFETSYLCTDYLGYTTEVKSPSGVYLGDTNFTLKLTERFKTYIEQIQGKYGK